MTQEVEMVGAIEAAMIDKIENATGMGYLKTVASYGGELDEDLGEVIRAYPAIWVVFAGSGKPEKLGAEKWKIPGTFVTMVAARNVRNEWATRKGDAKEIGTYQMLRHVRTLMMNEDFGLEVARFQPGAVRSLYNTKVRSQALSVFSQEWNTVWVEKVPTPDEKDLLKLGLNYYLTPGDAVVDAADLITVATL